LKFVWEETKRWAGSVAHMKKMRMHTKFLSESLKGRDHAEDLEVDGKILLQCILGK
jgi:hypothetical protein